MPPRTRQAPSAPQGRALRRGPASHPDALSVPAGHAHAAGVGALRSANRALPVSRVGDGTARRSTRARRGGAFGPDTADLPRLDAGLPADALGDLGVGLGQEGDHADPHVEGVLHVPPCQAAERAQQRDDGRNPDPGAIDPRAQPGRHDPREIRREAAAGHVREGVDFQTPGEVQAQRRVQARRLEELLAERAPEFGDVPFQRPPGVGHDAAHERVPIGVQSRSRQGEHDVAPADALGSQDGVRFDDAGGGPGDVVFLGGHEAGMLGGLPAQKGNVDRPAGPGDAPNDVGDAFGDHSAAGDVVRHEEGAGAHDGDVVDHHADEVLADGVVDVERPCDRDLRADAVGRGREQGSAVRAQIGDVHHPGEAAEPADDPAGERPADGRSHELDGRVARLTHTESEFGVQYDSLADLISFGVAPAIVIYQWSLHFAAIEPIYPAKLGWLTAFIYTACTALRLARFNVQVGVTDKAVFVGLPSPAAAAIVAGFVWTGSNYHWNGANLIMLSAVLTWFSALAMVSNFKYYSFKTFKLQSRLPFSKAALPACLIGLIFLEPAPVLFGLFLIYGLHGPIWTLWRIAKRRQGRTG